MCTPPSAQTAGNPSFISPVPQSGHPSTLRLRCPAPVLHTTDLGRIDDHGRLRLLGRADDEQIGGLWPRDTLDALGPLLGRRCALIRHPTTTQAAVQLLTTLFPEQSVALRDRAADLLGLPPDQVTITHQGNRPLLHSAKLSRTADNRVVR